VSRAAKQQADMYFRAASSGYYFPLERLLIWFAHFYVPSGISERSNQVFDAFIGEMSLAQERTIVGGSRRNYLSTPIEI
jgi:hypothetical protein